MATIRNPLLSSLSAGRNAANCRQCPIISVDGDDDHCASPQKSGLTKTPYWLAALGVPVAHRALRRRAAPPCKPSHTDSRDRCVTAQPSQKRSQSRGPDDKGHKGFDDTAGLTAARSVPGDAELGQAFSPGKSVHRRTGACHAQPVPECRQGWQRRRPRRLGRGRPSRGPSTVPHRDVERLSNCVRRGLIDVMVSRFVVSVGSVRACQRRL